MTSLISASSQNLRRINKEKLFSAVLKLLTTGCDHFQLKQLTLHLTLLVECSVLNFIRTEFRFIVVVKFNWLSGGETALENDLDKLKKVSARRF